MTESEEFFRAQHERLCGLLSESPVPLDAVVQLAEDFELRVFCGEPGADSGRATVVLFLCCQLLAYYAGGDEHSARHLWKRTPASVKSADDDGELRAVWAVGQALYLRNYPQLHRALRDVSAGAAEKPYAALLAACKQRIDDRLTRLVARAYESIAVADACAFLGVQPPQLLDLCQQLGWHVKDDYVYPALPAQPSQSSDLLSTVERLARFELFLDRI